MINRRGLLSAQSSHLFPITLTGVKLAVEVAGLDSALNSNEKKSPPSEGSSGAVASSHVSMMIHARIEFWHTPE